MVDVMATLAHTLGHLKASGWQSSPVKEEIRRNAVARIAAGEPLFEGVLGYEHTVMPQLENALLAGHDIIFLGERGQAKTRIIRSLTGLLDEWMPIVAGSEINDDPYSPVSQHARDLIAELGDDTPIEWVHRDDRYGEKLATPDTSIADLIGEVDPIKVAEGRYLSDELTLHYGLVPRTNRGIFAINELPDLAERIQVGLLNVLEERDVQVRGYKIRLPLDVMLVASANPEDYTNRGRIITPLKDRFGSQIRTHYPLDVETEVAIMRQEARPRVGRRRARCTCPTTWSEVVATFSHLARASTPRQPAQRCQRAPVGQQRRGARRPTPCAAALRAGEHVVVPRICDLEALAASSSGKIEIESLEEGREGSILDNLVKAAVLTVLQGAHHARSGPRRDRRVRGGRRRPRRRRHRLRRGGRACVEHGAGAARSRSGRSPAATSRRPPWPRPSSSSSRACTCRSASTRTRRAPAPPTAAAADPMRDEPEPHTLIAWASGLARCAGPRGSRTFLVARRPGRLAGRHRSGVEVGEASRRS